MGHPGGAGLARPPGGAGPGLGRNPRAGRRTRLDLARPAIVPWWRAGRRSAVRLRVRCGPPPGCLSFVYKAAAEIGELGDNVKALRAAIRGDRAAGPGPGRARGPGDGRRPHPLGQRRASSPSPTPTRSTPRRSDRPERPRTWSPPSTATSTTTPTCGWPRAAAAPGDHHRRQGHPDHRVPPAGRGGRPWTTRSAARWPASRVRWRSRRRRPPTPTSCSWPCAGRASRSTSAWPRTPSWWPASPTAWSRRRPGTCGWTGRRPRARSWPSTGTAPAASAAMRPVPLRRRPAPARRARRGHGRDHHQRHRPGATFTTSCSRS